MAVIEVGLPSGYMADYENQRADLIKLVETKKDKLVLYIDEVKYTVATEGHFMCNAYKHPIQLRILRGGYHI